MFLNLNFFKAYSKISDFTNSIEDCKNALKIDPSYSKAWGRLGLALLSNNQYEEAFEAYSKAIQLEPTNDGYKQNLKIIEDKLKTQAAAAGGMPGFPGMGGMPVRLSLIQNNQTLHNFKIQFILKDMGGLGNMSNMMGMFK